MTLEQWDEEKIYTDGDSFFESMLNQIALANSSILMEEYIFEGLIGKKVIEALAKASDRGVLVKLLLDGAGCSQWNFQDAEKVRRKNFELRFFHPLIWQRRNSKIWSYFNINKINQGFSLLNHRNHRKSCIIDEKIAFVGSMNVCDLHLKSISGEKSWRDTSVLLQGKDIKPLVDAFQNAWDNYQNYFFKYQFLKSFSNDAFLIKVNSTKKERKYRLENITFRIKNAKKRVWITNPYFVPPYRLHQVLQSTARAGIDVKMLFPSKSDFFGSKYVMEAQYISLLEAGIEIYEYQPSMIHSKTMITDEQALVGTSNMNTRSLLHDLEADAEITHPENIKLLQEQFLDDLTKAKKIELSQWRHRLWINKIFEKFFLWFRWVL